MKYFKINAKFYIILLIFSLTLPLADFFLKTAFCSDLQTLIQNEKYPNEKAELNALALNYCRYSLGKILYYKDRIVIDEEYNTIINNIDLTKITNSRVKDLITSLMDYLTEFKIDRISREKLQTKYERQLSNAVYEAFSGITNVMYVGGGNPYVAAAMVTVNIGTSYMNYKKNIQRYRDELDDKVWALEQKDIRNLNTFEKDFFDTAWAVTHEYNMPDIWRLTNKQFDYFAKCLDDSDVNRKYRNLKTISKYFHSFPPYWYQLGLAALDVNQKDEALKAFDIFLKVRKGFFREDTIYTSVLMNKINLLDSKNDKETIINYLNAMYDESFFEWNKNIYLALKYYEYGMYENGKTILQFNIDNNHLFSLSSSLLAKIYMLENDKQNFDRLIDIIIEKDRVNNLELIALSNIIQDERLLNKIKDELFAISIDFDTKSLRKDDLLLKIPTKWLIGDISGITICTREKSIDDDSKSYNKENLSLDYIIGESEISGNKFIPLDTEKFIDQYKKKKENLIYFPEKLFITISTYDTLFRPSEFQANKDKESMIYRFENFCELDDMIEKIATLPILIDFSSAYGNISLVGTLSRHCKINEDNKSKVLVHNPKIFKNKIIFYLKGLIEIVCEEIYSTLPEEKQKEYSFKNVSTLSEYLLLLEKLVNYFDQDQKINIKATEKIKKFFLNIENDKEMDEAERNGVFIVFADIFSQLEEIKSKNVFNLYYSIIDSFSLSELAYTYLTQYYNKDSNDCNYKFIVCEIIKDGITYGILENGMIKHKTDNLMSDVFYAHANKNNKNFNN